MSIVWIVYLVSVVTNIGVTLGIIGVLLIVGHCMRAFNNSMKPSYKTEDKPSGAWFCTGAALLLLSCLFPGEKATNVMVVAYVGSELAETNQAAEVGSKAYEALNKVLDDYLTEETEE